MTRYVPELPRGNSGVGRCRWHTHPPLLEESFHLVWEKHADGHITVQYVKELKLEEQFGDCCEICWTRTVFTTAMNYREREMLCVRCAPDSLCNVCIAFFLPNTRVSVCLACVTPEERQNGDIFHRDARRRLEAVEYRNWASDLCDEV